MKLKTISLSLLLVAMAHVITAVPTGEFYRSELGLYPARFVTFLLIITLSLFRTQRRILAFDKPYYCTPFAI